jgi:hypothetical protein
MVLEVALLAALSAVSPDLADDALLRAARGGRDLRLRLRDEASLSLLIYASVRVQATRAIGGGNFSFRQVSSPKTRFHLRSMRVDEGEYHLRQETTEHYPVFPALGNSHAGSFLAQSSSPRIPFRTPGDRLDLSKP